MKIVFTGNGDGLQLQIVVNWRSIRAALKAIFPVVAALLSLLAAPEIMRLVAFLGW